MLWIKVRQGEIVCLPYVADNDRLAGDIRATLWRCLVSLGNDAPDDAGIPAASGLDEEIVFGRSVSADLAERDAKGSSANFRRLIKNGQQVAFLEGKTPKRRQRSLLAAETLHCLVTIGRQIANLH